MLVTAVKAAGTVVHGTAKVDPGWPGMLLFVPEDGGRGWWLRQSERGVWWEEGTEGADVKALAVGAALL